MLCEVLSAIFELVAYQANSIQISAHRELGILGLGSAGTSASLRKRLMVESKGKANEASDFTCMKHWGAEGAQLDRAVATLLEERMQVEENIAA